MTVNARHQIRKYGTYKMTRGKSWRPSAKGREWVTASELATASTCPYQVYLQKNGAERSESVVKSMRHGNIKHDQYNKRFEPLSRKLLRWLVIAALLTICLIGAVFISARM